MGARRVPLVLFGCLIATGTPSSMAANPRRAADARLLELTHTKFARIERGPYSRGRYVLIARPRLTHLTDGQVAGAMASLATVVDRPVIVLRDGTAMMARPGQAAHNVLRSFRRRRRAKPRTRLPTPPLANATRNTRKSAPTLVGLRRYLEQSGSVPERWRVEPWLTKSTSGRATDPAIGSDQQRTAIIMSALAVTEGKTSRVNWNAMQARPGQSPRSVLRAVGAELDRHD